MENQKSNNKLEEYQLALNKLICTLTLEKLSNFFESQQSHLRQPLLWCDSSFLGSVQRNIILAKKKILQEVLNCYPLLKDTEIKLIRSKIKVLTMPPQNILRDGIIALYSDISQLKQSNLDKFELSMLLQKIKKFIQPLLRDHFVLKQIQKMDTKFIIKSLRAVMSQKRICSDDSLTSINSEHSIKQFLSDRAVMEISRNIQCKSIQELINQELKGEEDEINQGFQTCRICRQMFKLKYLERHVEYCSKIETYNSKKQEIFTKQLQTIQDMKKQISGDQIIFDIKDPAFQLQVNKIYKKIIDCFQQSPKLYRRISANAVKKPNKKQRRLSFEIQQYLIGNGKNQLLLRYRSLTRERQLIQKKITSLENNYLHYDKFQDTKQNSGNSLGVESAERISRSFKTTKLMNIKTKKSLFARKSDHTESHSQNNIHQILKFQSIKAHMHQIIDSDEDSFVDKQKLCKSMSHFIKKEDKNCEICINDFQIIKFLGKGAFGKVYMVRRKQTKDIYALKVIKIQQNWGQKQLSAIKNEHQILSQIAGQHLVKAPFSFTEGQAHFFVLQYMPGGDLGKIIQEQVYLDINQARFYLAEIVLALEHLHNMGIIHRDLKPENLIFDQKGHLKLTDFGLSEIRINDKIRRARKMYINTVEELDKRIWEQQGQKRGKLKSALVEGKNKIKLIGTPDYIAPEIISGESLDNLSIDWWSMGVIAYEMLVGCRPFCANSIDDVIKNIQQFNIEWPEIGQGDDMINPIAADLIKKLLIQNHRQRLGAKSIQQIKNHEFFKGINWQNIKQQKPPLIPAMDRKQKYQFSQQIPELKNQILSAMGNSKAKSSFKLDNFVRYDILVEETLQSADRQIIKRETRIKKLKSIASNFGNSSNENKDSVDDNDNTIQLFSNKDIESSLKHIQNIE